MSDGPVSNMESGDRASRDRTTEGIVRRLIGGGIALAARFTTSLRVGSGSATLAALDGTDGAVMADGAVAGVYFRNRADATKYGALYRNGTIRVYASETGDLWLIDPATGAATLALTGGAWTTVAAGVGFTNSWVDNGGGFQVARYRKNILGNVEVQGMIKSGTLGVAAFTLPVGMRPPAQVPVPAYDGAGAGCRCEISTSGAFFVQSGNTAFIGFNTQFSTT